MTESVPEPAATGEGTVARAEAVTAQGTAATPAPATAPAAGPAAAPAASEASAPTAAPASLAGPVRRDWRGRRPFWGGLLVTLGGAEILFTLWAPLPLLLHISLVGLAGYLVPSVMLLCGLLILFNPTQRLFYSVLAVLASLASWVTSNLGGFLIGMLLGVVGACLTFGWLPDQPLRRGRQRREDRRAQRRAARAGV
ncbi:Integral membrane protein OS=Kitasatospora aureofaciens OX=1894 GN=GCM10010502_06250 PE=4 SV=1 [Kitasatospora aureofaciens]|uniref:DUF6114 domain-containing protein n=1 Tax=Kitasatospora aureofaciens TaxID=1894 RepID=UPI000A87A6FA